MNLRGSENLPSPIAAKMLQVPNNQHGSEWREGREGTDRAGEASCPAGEVTEHLAQPSPRGSFSGKSGHAVPSAGVAEGQGGEGLAQPL